MTMEGELTGSGDNVGLAAFLGENEAGGGLKDHSQDPSQLEMRGKVSQGALPIQQHA